MRRFLVALAFCGLWLGTMSHGHAGETVQIAVDGQPRNYLLERARNPGPRSTIIMFHGANGTSERVAQLTALPVIAAQEGFTTVYPQARGPVWNRFLPGMESSQTREIFSRAGGIPNDIGFLKSLVADLVRRGVADPARIFIAGHSNGGFMALTMFCNEGGLFAGIGLLTSAMMEQTGAE